MKPEEPRRTFRFSCSVDGLEAGAPKRIFAGEYTRILEGPLESFVIRSWAVIVSYLLPGAVLAYRSTLKHPPLTAPFT